MTNSEGTLVNKNLLRLGAIGAAALAGSIALAGCSSTPAPTDTTAALSGTITAGGSSAQANAEAAWTAAFKATNAGVTINYDKTQGSGGGRTQFISGAYDFGGSDAPLNADETTSAAAKFPGGAVDLPIYLDGVSIAYNVSGVTSLNLSTATLAKVFARTITDWSDPAITADNGGTALPAGPITTVVRSDSSGTATNLTNFLYASDPTDWKWPGSGSWPTDITGTDAQKGGSAVAGEVAKVAGSIGYVDHSAAKDGSGNPLATATVNGIAFSADAVAKAFSDGATTKSNGVAGDLSQSFDYTKINADTAAYPIPLLSYAIIPLTFATPAQGTLTKAYLAFIASTTGQQTAAANAGSVPLPDSILSAVNATLATVK